jgi:hypothetical protein
MGGALRRRRGAQASTSWRTSKVKSSPTLGTSNSYVASTPRKDFQVFLHISNALVGCIDVNFLLNKVNGDSTFSPKTKSPSGATAGGIPPKMVPFLRKKALLQKC